ncbi:hypothetical protein GO491_10825 [Flavobacteriaceae bacterium Ap0902]|nr:hypothetical protein [Flavobacteriaceae bacterium Ap0902]
MKKILHIANDDKFVPLGKIIFDSVNNVQNDYWILPKEGDIEYCKFPCRNIYNLDFKSDKVIDEINTYDLLCIEFLNPKFYDILNHKNFDRSTLWIGWGGDYYWLINTLSGFDILLPKTKKLIYKFHHKLLPTRIANSLKKFRRQKNYKAIQNIEYFAPPIFLDYKLIQDHYPNFKPKYIQWNYGYINEAVLEHFSSLKTNGNKVMIGNSATPSNNHLDVFYNLKDILSNQKLIIPLNYGDMKYKNYLTRYLSIHFKVENIEILDKLLPSTDFDNKLLECKNLIIGSMRQQALSTIIKALIFGLNVFLYERSINYTFLRQEGFHIQTIESLIKNPNLLNYNSTSLQINENKQRIQELWSLSHNINQIQELMSNI